MSKRFTAVKTLVSVTCLGASLGMAASSQAASVPITLTPFPGYAPGPQGTAIFGADLSAIGFDEILSITLVDSNSKQGGSSGAFSGFDLDAIKLSNTNAASAAQAVAAPSLDAFDFSPASTFFTPGTQRPPADAKLNGTDASGNNVDAAFATLHLFDAIWFGAGSVTLGDGGSITFNLKYAVPTTNLFLYLGEVSGDPGEALAGRLLVSDRPAEVPLPAAAWFAGSGLIGLFGMTRKRRQQDNGA